MKNKSGLTARSAGVAGALAFALLTANCTGEAAPAAHVVFAQESAAINEGAGVLRIAVRMVTASAKELLIPLRYLGSATRGEDYEAPDAVVIPAHAQEAVVELKVLDDALSECPESVVIELAQTPGVIAVARRRFAVEVTDDEPHGRTFKIGGKNGFAKPSEVADLVKNGDVVEINAGEFIGDVAVWRADDLMLCGKGEGPQLRAGGKSAEDKAIWVIKGHRAQVENIHFSGARVADANGAGIRAEGVGLTIRHSSFVQNENGILAGNQTDSTITIEHSTFRKNGAGDGYSHNIYVGKIARLNMRFCTITEAVVGHNVKSRARETLLEYNRIMDGAEGNASYQVDVPNGGIAWLIGNVIQQGPKAENSTMIAFGAEGLSGTPNRLTLASNTIVTDRSSATFVSAVTNTSCVWVNNALAGNGDMKCANVAQNGNVVLNSGFRDRAQYVYHPLRDAKVVDAGISPGPIAGMDLQPRFEYDGHGVATRRVVQGPPDAGAFEYHN